MITLTRSDPANTLVLSVMTKTRVSGKIFKFEGLKIDSTTRHIVSLFYLYPMIITYSVDSRDEILRLLNLFGIPQEGVYTHQDLPEKLEGTGIKDFSIHSRIRLPRDTSLEKCQLVFNMLIGRGYRCVCVPGFSCTILR